MDPELARWLSPDPLGYVDGPNLYQGFLNDPLNNSDPLGLTVVVLWFGKGSYYGAGEGFEDLLGKLAEQAAARNQHYRTMAINDWERNRLYEIGRSTGYVESPESLKVIAVSDVKNDPRGRMDVLEKTLSELSPGEDIYIVGHSRGAHRATWFAKRLASKGVKVRGLVAVDFFQWFSSKRIPSNVEQFLAFYSAPSPETRERRTAEGSRHSPGSGASEFGLAPETVDYGVYSLDETHQAMDSNPFVHEKVLQLVGGTLRPPPEPTCWKCIELAFRLFYGVGGGGPDE